MITTKAGDAATFAVALTSIPANNQTVTLNLLPSTPLDASLSTYSLTFNAANWNVYQMVTVTGNNFPPASGTVSFQIDGTASSGDGNYNNKTMTPISITNINPNDIAVSGTSLTTTKTGGAASFSVALTTAPAYDVTINLTSADPSEGQLSTNQLTFTPQDWSSAQTVAVTGLNNGVVEGNAAYQITGTANSEDPVYNNMIMSPVNVLNTGNLNTAGITVTAANPLITTQAGGMPTSRSSSTAPPAM